MCLKKITKLQNALFLHKNFKRRWKSLTCTLSDLISWLVGWEVTVHAFVGVTDVPLVARLSNLPGTTLAAATAIQDRAHPWGTVRPFLTLTGPLAKLSPLRNSLPISGSQLCITLWTAETLCVCVVGEVQYCSLYSIFTINENLQSIWVNLLEDETLGYILKHSMG